MPLFEDNANNQDDKMGPIAILSQATRNGCNRIREDLLKKYHLSPESLPSYYLLVKSRPSMVGSILDANLP